jgi:AraC-like DNA-binding protein
LIDSSFGTMSAELQLRDWSNVRADLAWIYEGSVQPAYRNDVCRPHFLGAWLLLAGSVRLTQGHTVVEANRGQWLVLRQAEGFQNFSDDAKILSVRFTAEWPDRRPFYDEGLSVTFPAAQNQALERAARGLLGIARPYLADDPHALLARALSFNTYAALKVAFWAWFAELHRALEDCGITPTRTRLDDERIIAVLHELDRLPFSTKICEPDLAKLAGLEVGHFVRTFRQQVGATPKRYFMKRRRAVCRRLLAGSKIPIKEIALDLGFSRLSDFSTWFREAEGVSPRQFRQKLHDSDSPV